MLYIYKIIFNFGLPQKNKTSIIIKSYIKICL